MNEIIKKIIGLDCFKAKHIYGTMFYMDFGYPIVTFDDKDEKMEVRGEWGITVESAAWGISKDGEETSITSDDSIVERKSAISDIIGQTIHEITFDPPNSRLTIYFLNRFKQNMQLDVYVNYAEDMTDNEAALWSLATPHSIITFYKEGKFDEEQMSAGEKRLTISH